LQNNNKRPAFSLLHIIRTADTRDSVTVTWLCQISWRSVEPLLRYDNLTVSAWQQSAILDF